MQKTQVDNVFENIILPVLTHEEKQEFEKEFPEKEVIDALKSFSNNKSSGIDGLIDDF